MIQKIIAIDPGKHGGIAIDSDGKVSVYDMPQTPKDLLDFFREHFESGDVVVMEEVGGYIGRAMPGSRMFVFGRQFGNLEMAVLSAGYRLELVKPQRWQSGLSLGTAKGMPKTQWKNKLKAMAQRLYPDIKVTLSLADALLILEYARRCK